MPSFKHRVLITLAATALAAGCGALGGWMLGRSIALRLTGRSLVRNASRASAEADLRLGEAQSVIAAMRGSSFAPCSGAELTYFRALVFDARYLKDAGRMSEGRIECSASLARPAQPLEEAQQDFTLAGGIKVYRNLALYQSEDQAMIALRQGEFYIVFIPYIQPHPAPGPENYTETVRDSVSGQVYRLAGEPPPENGALRISDGSARLGESLYATSCSRSFSNCITAFVSIPEAMRADRIQLAMNLGLGGLAGGFLGLFCSIVYRRSRSMEQQLRRAIRRDELRMVYQPIVDLATRRIVGAEALARWTDEEGFAVSPDVFVKIAEQRGFVGEITRLVVRRVLHEFGEVLRAHPGFHISINVAAADLGDPGFLPMLEEALERARVPAGSLIIEITETSTAVRQTAVETIHELHRRGHSVHIDDFGTGYSSLSYLQDLSVDAIKIDKSFTQAIGTDAVTVSILPQVLNMAESLKMQVIVEGIETSLQAGHFPAQSKPILGQGWLFGRPVPAEAFLRLKEADEEAAQAPPEAAFEAGALCHGA